MRAKPGKVLAYLFCHLLWIAQQLKDRREIRRSRVLWKRISSYIRLSSFRNNSNKKVSVDLGMLLLKLPFLVILPQINLARNFLFLFKITYISENGLSYAIKEQEVGTDNYLQIFYCRCSNCGGEPSVYVPNFPPDGAGCPEITFHGQTRLAKGALSAMSH